VIKVLLGLLVLSGAACVSTLAFAQSDDNTQTPPPYTDDAPVNQVPQQQDRDKPPEDPMGLQPGDPIQNEEGRIDTSTLGQEQMDQQATNPNDPALRQNDQNQQDDQNNNQ
jgi:hypothetical protein